MTRNSLFKLFSITAVLMLLIVACGDDDDDADPTSTSPSEGGAPTETRDTGDGENGGDDDLAAMGEQVANQNGCLGCHSTDGSEMVGPTWQGLWMSEVPLEDGSTVTADEAYITESIHEPSAKVHEGFQDGLMPAFPDMAEDDVNAIIAYIESLSE